jgi:type IV pilus assembly protein PilE
MTKAWPTPRPQSGLTLIELLIVLVCIAVLASAAWPSYQRHLLRSQRANARTALMQTAHWLERAAASNGNYPAATDIPSSVLTVAGQRYALQASTTTQSFSLSATPLGSQTQDACGTLTLNHLGERGVQNASQSATTCWAY